MTTPDEHRRNAIEQAAKALFANDGLWDVSLDAHKAPHRARAERAIDAALADLRRAFAEEAAAKPDRWEYGRYDVDDDRVMAFEGTPRYITPKMLRRPLAAVGPWRPATGLEAT